MPIARAHPRSENPEQRVQRCKTSSGSDHERNGRLIPETFPAFHCFQRLFPIHTCARYPDLISGAISQPNSGVAPPQLVENHCVIDAAMSRTVVNPERTRHLDPDLPISCATLYRPRLRDDLTGPQIRARALAPHQATPLITVEATEDPAHNPIAPQKSRQPPSALGCRRWLSRLVGIGRGTRPR
jgi:hypothetical protein